ncbi:MAG: type II secretion system protein [Bacillota bacterium]|nr:type II secretion system protein [Bacillota bacterium]
MKNSQDGFLLIELLVALVVLAIVATPLLSLLILGTDTLAGAGRHTAAAYLARDKMEEVKGYGYFAVVAETEDGLQGYVREVAVVQPGCTEDDVRLKQVSVTVYWVEGGREQSVVLTTFLSGR